MFIKLTGSEGSYYININQITYFEKADSKEIHTSIALNYMGYIYVKETPEEILKLIEECEK